MSEKKTEQEQQLSAEQLDDVVGGYQLGQKKPSTIPEILDYLSNHYLCKKAQPGVDPFLCNIAEMLYGKKLTVGTPAFDVELQSILRKMRLI